MIVQAKTIIYSTAESYTSHLNNTFSKESVFILIGKQICTKLWWFFTIGYVGLHEATQKSRLVNTKRLFCVAREGFEPPQTEPKSAVLPLDDRAIRICECKDKEVKQSKASQTMKKLNLNVRETLLR